MIVAFVVVVNIVLFSRAFGHCASSKKKNVAARDVERALRDYYIVKIERDEAKNEVIKGKMKKGDEKKYNSKIEERNSMDAVVRSVLLTHLCDPIASSWFCAE